MYTKGFLVPDKRHSCTSAAEGEKLCDPNRGTHTAFQMDEATPNASVCARVFEAEGIGPQSGGRKP